MPIAGAMDRPSDTQHDLETLLADAERARAYIAMGLVDAEQALNRTRIALKRIREALDDDA